MPATIQRTEDQALAVQARDRRVRTEGRFFAWRGERLRLRGATYGPFEPNAKGEPLPPTRRVVDDLARMKAAGINSLRTYHVPPDWFLDISDEEGVLVFVDVPWRKHLCFLESRDAQEEARARVREAAERARSHPSVLACSVGNEIPADVVRWHGAPRVERFLRELMDAAKQVHPEGLVTYANYPSTEYLDLSFLDFLTFNVYLHDREAFVRYLLRLHNLAGEKPLVLGEIGMDTFRHGEREQARFLWGHLREAALLGTAGAYVFSWTDDWCTGGHRIEDWAFGITQADRTPRPAYHALKRLFRRPLSRHLTETPRVSVVVCSYNGGSTLAECLDSLLRLDYPDYEVILVDDGSTDATRPIAARFPTVRTIHQPNQGLSVARNVGLQAATGSIVAYTDSDCFADPDWLTHLVHQLERTGAAAVGGPNLTPADGWLAACVAASPGQPTHVLESDHVAEHIPGCNMAFRRTALEGIGGFDPEYRKAGDDVDVCWRLQQQGHWIAFAPGAFVWHHRRQNPRAYLRQQGGYGEAEALLRFKHPDKFNGRGDSKWRGVVYGASLSGLRLSGPAVFRGTFGTGLFQTLYQPGPAHWAMLPSTLEWHAGAAAAGLLSLLAPAGWPIAAGMLALSGLVAGLQAAQAQLEEPHNRFRSRLVVAGLCYAQPLVRGWSRYVTRLRRHRPPRTKAAPAAAPCCGPGLLGTRTLEYWTEEWRDRQELLTRIADHLKALQWTRTVDPGWTHWDLEVHCHAWTALRIRTVQEDHGSGRRLLRAQYGLRLTKLAWSVGVLGAAAASAAALLHSLPAAAGALGSLLLLLGARLRGTRLAGQVAHLVDGLAQDLSFTRCQPCTGPQARRPAAGLSQRLSDPSG